ncbi:minor capsid protein [Geoglobus acetivorans]|uniref:Minor capsid protein n=1 Tax=Geoglobus acetivorans TaxID=565033 RepID=A0ABZ3H2S3_GEOAI|nr:minor capsid protein [Geoglobus acetivorans]
MPDYPVEPTKTRVLRDEYARKLKNLTESAKFKVISALGNGDVIEEAKTIVDQEIVSKSEPIVRKYNQKFYRKGGEFAGKQLKKHGIEVVLTPDVLEIVDQDIINELNNLTLDLIKGLGEDTKKRLAYELRTGLLQGESVPKLANRVRSVFDASKTRAEMIARTESIRAFNTAAIRRYERAGIKKYRWIVAWDERLCSKCAPLHNQVFRIGANPPPPLHPRCRCTVIPVLEKPVEEKPSEIIREITGDSELDEKISRALADYEKILNEERSFSRALNKYINGRAISVSEAEKRGKEYIKFFGKGGPEEVRSYIQNVLPYRVNSKVVERAGKVKIRTTAGRTYKGRYYHSRREIQISKHYGEKERTFMHEYGHHLDHTLYLDETRKFFIARVKKHGYRLEMLRKHEQYSHLGFDIFHFDGFDHIDPYAGRVYLGTYVDEHYKRLRKLIDNPKLIETDPDIRNSFHTELLSVGMEYFTREELMKELWEKDRELFGFILSLLRGK